MQRATKDAAVVDADVLARTAQRLGQADVLLPTFSELADPARIPSDVRAELAGVDPDAPHPRNLFRVHWYNGRDRRSTVSVPEHVVLPRELTGVAAPILVLLGDRFPMIGAHKVLAAYGCLVPRIVSGEFDPSRHRAVWPSTGNYCRGGVAISRILGCRGVAVLPAGMSAARFRWLERWVAGAEDIVRTPGTESNVKEIYDECARLSRDPDNFLFNQFRELGNYLVHYHCTGTAVRAAFEAESLAHGGFELAAFVSATGSAGTIAAGDRLKEELGARVAAVDARECPTRLYNGFGEHNIQGIGDKHVPFIHNVMGTDFVIGVSDRATDRLDVLFQSEVGRSYLSERRGVPPAVLAALSSFGLSSVCNVLAAIKLAKYLDLGPKDVVATVATDGAELYATERAQTTQRRFSQGLDAVAAGEAYGEHVLGQGTDHLLELSHDDRKRIFNLGYFTWVEQQGVSVADFEARRAPSYWRSLRDELHTWDERIRAFNARAAAAK